VTAWIGEVRLPDHLHLSRPRADRRGAVMGSKNLKSIVVRGTGKVAVKDLEGLKKLTQWGAKNVRVNVAMAGLQNYGTAETVLVQQSVGGLPTHNGDSGVFDQAEEISGERMYDTILREGSGRN
jgi:aldehyde:ferredoxin oxidoreductase